MKWRFFCCAGASDRGWAAWIPAMLLLGLITFQLLDRASEDPSSNDRAGASLTGEAK